MSNCRFERLRKLLMPGKKPRRATPRVVRKSARAGRHFDPIDLEVLWNRLVTLVDEAAYAIIRTSMSKVVVEGRDFGVMLYDGEGNLLAADASIASKPGVTSVAVKELLNYFSAQDLRPGDVIVSNNPWWFMGHLNDIGVVAPLFYEDRLIGFIESMAHMADIGGLLSGMPREVYEEGLIIPPLKAVEGGQENATFFAMLEANVRVPEQVTSDVRALITGLHVMQESMSSFLSKHALDGLTDLSVAIRERSEAAMRRGIRDSIPEGMYRGSSSVDGFDGQALGIEVTITVRDGSMIIDYAGSAAQSPFGINSTLVYTNVWSLYAVKCITCPDVPNNQGTFAPITVTAPEGSLLNPIFPAPVKMKPSTGHYLPIAILDALKDVIPERILAESGNKSLVYLAGRKEDGRAFSDLIFVMGGMGARAGKDGLHTIGFPANSSNIPIEVLERSMPLRVREKGLRTDSGGAGRQRGGCGQFMEFESLSAFPLTVRAEHGKLDTPPAGLRGGLPGAAGGQYLNGHRVEDKVPVQLVKGDVMRLEIPGSGGTYAPHERDPLALYNDVQDGLVSRATARRHYGRSVAKMSAIVATKARAKAIAKNKRGDGKK